MEVAIDVVDESDASGQEMDGSDAAAEESIGFVRDFVVDVAGGELRFVGGSVFRFVEAAFDSTLAVGEPAREDVLHLKSFCACGVWESSYFLKHRNHGRISSLFRMPPRSVEELSLG